MKIGKYILILVVLLCIIGLTYPLGFTDSNIVMYIHYSGLIMLGIWSLVDDIIRSPQNGKGN